MGCCILSVLSLFRMFLRHLQWAVFVVVIALILSQSLLPSQQKVPATSLFHAKDLVDGAPGCACSRAVLKCLAALSDAARRNASTDPPGTAYEGPLLGDEESDYHAKTAEENGSAGGLTAAAGGSGGGGGSTAGGGGGGGRRAFWRLSSKGSNSSGWTGSDLDRGRGAAGKFRDGFAEEMPPPSPGSSLVSVGRARDA